jgi:hypothetical protein
MRLLKLIFSILFICTVHAGHSQIKVTSYSIYSIGTSLSLNEKFDAELKIFTNKEQLEDTNLEISGKYKFKPSDYHQISAGIGFGLIPNSGEDAFFSIPVALELFPIQSNKRISCVFELAPEIFFNDDKVSLRHLWGIRYSFNK